MAKAGAAQLAVAKVCHKVERFVRSSALHSTIAVVGFVFTASPSDEILIIVVRLVRSKREYICTTERAPLRRFLTRGTCIKVMGHDKLCPPVVFD